METSTQKQDKQNLSEQKNEDFEIFELDVIDQPTLQHDQ